MTPTPSETLRLRFEASLARLAESSRLRALHRPSESPSASPLVDFSSNDYLGLRRDPRLSEAGARAASRYGAGSGSSRAVLASDGASFELEERVCALGGWRSATFFPSGFMANLALFDAIAPFEFEESEGLEILIDARSHASLITGARLTGAKVRFFPHGGHGALARSLASSSAPHRIVVVEALHSMDGDFEDLASLLAVVRDGGALAIVDEAHSFGIRGPLGMGVVAGLPWDLREHVLATMLGCGKAMGVAGGLVAAPEWFTARLRQKARPFLFSTGGPPFVAGAVSAAHGLAASKEGNERRSALQSNVTRLREGLGRSGRAVLGDEGSPITGFVIGNDAGALAASEALRARGYLVKAIRPPTVPRGTSRLRVICHASHLPSELDGLCTASTSPA